MRMRYLVCVVYSFSHIFIFSSIAWCLFVFHPSVPSEPVRATRPLYKRPEPETLRILTQRDQSQKRIP